MPAPVKKLNVSLIKRNAIKRGPTSSDAWNDSFEEVSNDLNRLVTQWNDALYPILAGLPDGTNDLDAYETGLDGTVIYVDMSAVSTVTDTTYWNSANSRPNSVKEQFEKVYTKFITQKAELQTEITNASGALTQAQKDRIGANVFDGGATSLSTSLDGKSENNSLNITQLARDLYGAGFSLDNDGAANLLNNSVYAMVDALLALHNGNWDNDVTLNHDAVSGGDFKSDGTVAMTGVIKLANGSAGTPSLTFNTDTTQDTGFYKYGENQIGVTVGGVNTLVLGGTGAEITAVDGTLALTGGLAATGIVSSATTLRQADGYVGTTVNSGTAVSHIFDTVDNYSNAAAKLVSFKNFGTEKAFIDKDGNFSTSGQLSSTVATGTAPFTVASTTKVTNLNADTIDGIDSASLVQTSRAVNTSTGLTGGGALSSDLTLSVASFTGVLSKSSDPGSQSYTNGASTLILSIDATANASIIPMRLVLPPTVDADLFTQGRFIFSDLSYVTVENTNTAVSLTRTAENLIDDLMGTSNNGKRIQKIEFYVENRGAAPVVADITAFSVRAYVTPAGSGAAL